MCDKFLAEYASDTACMNFAADRRGWSMKYGHRKRLLKPKRGKAAQRAEIQGQGKEVLRGRSAFSRTINESHRRGRSPWYSKYGTWGSHAQTRARTKLRKIAISDAREALHSSHRHSLVKVIDVYMTGAEDRAVEPDEISSWSDEWNGKDSDNCIGEVSSLGEAPACESPLPIGEELRNKGGPCSSTPIATKAEIDTNPWELAVARAQQAAEVYALHVMAHGKPQREVKKVQRPRQNPNIRPRRSRIRFTQRSSICGPGKRFTQSN